MLCSRRLHFHATNEQPMQAAVIPSEVENGSDWGSGDIDERPEAERKGIERIKPRCVRAEYRRAPSTPKAFGAQDDCAVRLLIEI
jgi:hypothetical protein